MRLQDFLHMGGYAGYVWSSFGLTLVVLVANVVLARRRHAAKLTELERRLRVSGETA